MMEANNKVWTPGPRQSEKISAMLILAILALFFFNSDKKNDTIDYSGTNEEKFLKKGVQSNYSYVNAQPVRFKYDDLIKEVVINLDINRPG